MKILALIPARGGSKRLTRKNIRKLGELPLIAWTIRRALRSEVCCDIVVSTDDPEIAELARSYGAEVPGLRPAELATDTASSIDVALHALTIWEERNGPADALMLLQPTSPFRSTQTIRQAARLHEQLGAVALIGVSPAHSHPAWCFRVENGYLTPYFFGEGLKARSQDLPAVFAINGAMYIINPKTLRQEQTFFPVGARPLIMENPIESLDIDTPWDWEIAEALVNAGKVKAPPP